MSWPIMDMAKDGPVVLPSAHSGAGLAASMLFLILVLVVQVMNANWGYARGGILAQAAHRSGWMSPASSIWNFGARRAGRRKYRRGGRFKAKSRRSCLMGTHPEKKFLDLTVATAPAVAGTVSGELATIVQGAGESNRVGRKAIITDILFKGHISTAAVAGGTGGSNRIRIDIVQDTQPNKAAFTVGDYNASTDINFFRELTQAKRFKTLWTRVYTINAKAGGGDGTTNWIAGNLVPVRGHIKCCIDMEYDAVGGAIGTQTINSLFLVVWEESATPATATNIGFRLRFVE